MSNCHICGHELEPKLDLGDLPLANAFITDLKAKGEVWYRGVWSWCPECQLLQLAEPPLGMFTEDYPYKTSTSQAMLKHFEDTAEALYLRYDPATAAEIGCSDGGMIQFLENCATVGFEPSKACWKSLVDKNITYYDAFNAENVDDAVENLLDSKFDLIYSANTLRSIPELGAMLELAKDALHPIWGVLVIEEPYLLPILANNEFDQFYDENVFCLTATSMARIAERFGLHLYDVDILPTHGGSVRYHLCQVGHGESIIETERLQALWADEINLSDRLNTFNEAADKAGRELENELVDLGIAGKRVVGYGATAKSSTVICGNGITTNLIECIYDNSETKIGKFTPGNHIPVVSADCFKDDDADVVVLFAWNHAKEIIARENTIKPRKWLVYVPDIRYL